MNRRLLFVFFLSALALVGCDQGSTTSTPNGPSVAPLARIDTINKADDWRIFVNNPVGSARSIPQSGTYTWPTGSVITVSLFYPVSGQSITDPATSIQIATPPATLPDILDTITRSWISLINPDGGKSIVFKIIGDNDASALVKVYYVSGAYSTGSSTLALTQWSASGNNILNAALTVYGTAAGISTWANNSIYLYHVVLHEFGHVLNVGHDPDNTDDVMNAGYNLTTANNDFTYQRYFGTNAIETINALYNGGASNYSPYQPICIRRVGGGWDNTPILGWTNIRAAAKAGNRVILKGIVGNAGYLPNNIYSLTNTSGNPTYWNQSNTTSYNAFLATAGCADRAANVGSAVFSALSSDATNSVLAVTNINGEFFPAKGYLVWGDYYPGNSCQLQLGSFYTLYPA